MKNARDYCFSPQLMDGDLASDDGERDDETTRETVVALRKIAALASSQAEKLERLLVNAPERELLTMDLPVAGSDGGRRRPTAAPMLPEVRAVQRIIRHRQMRKHCFDDSLFADPAWDMLLDLTAATIEGKRLMVTSLCIASGVPPTTALRWIGVMVERGLFQRQSDPIDHRRCYVSLTSKGLRAMASYFGMIDARP